MLSRPGRSRRRLIAITTIVVIVGAAAGTSAWAIGRHPGPAYRTAAVTRGSVRQTLTTTAVLSPVHSASADFQVAGTVSAVRAKVGHPVKAGQTLARLNRSSLRAAVRAANSELASARAQLSRDESGETSVTSTGSAATGSTGRSSTDTGTRAATTNQVSLAAAQVSANTATDPTASPRPSGSPGPRPSGSGNPTSGRSSGPITTKTLERDQQAVVSAQRATDAALATAKTALATERTACASEDSGTPPSTPATSSNASPGTLTCTQAAAGLLHDQQVVSHDESTVDTAEQRLSSDLSTAVTALNAQQGGSSSKSGRTTQGSGFSGSSGSSSSVVAVTAADLATDQASIDQAKSELATAHASVRQATLSAPISGTVTAVTISRSDSVSGRTNSTDPAIEIVGSRQDKATVYLSDTQVRLMKAGLQARVTPDGTSTAVSGHVVSIGASGTESASGSVTYPVTIDVSDPQHHLVAGADAAAAITLATASNVIVVPTSAVHYQGSTSYVELLNGSKQVRHTVTVTAVGPALTEVAAGLSVGTRVVLANLDAAVPSSSTQTGRLGFGGGFTISGGPRGGNGGRVTGATR
jgi:multidrug efflux pump subunit AcrA (membrane-fusion protein)